MKNNARALIAAAAVASSVAIAAGVSWAQSSDAGFPEVDVMPPGAEERMLDGTAAEKEALEASDRGKHVRARELAEAILDDNPDSLIATRVLATVFSSADGNQPRALFLMRKARRLLEQHYGSEPTVPKARKWHRDLLEETAWILGQMDLREEQIGILDDYDALYKPPAHRQRLWPLVKLGRFAEAREIGVEMTRSERVGQRVSAFNGLMALESERMDREASYQWGVRGIEATQERSCILYHNTSLSAVETFRFDKAEEFGRKGLRTDIKDCANPSYSRLAPYYLMRGQFAKAVSSLEKLRDHPFEPHERQQFQMGNRSLLVDLLYATGNFERGAEMSRQIYRTPDRPGMSSWSAEEFRFGFAVAYWMLLDGKAEALRERRAVAPWGTLLSEFTKRTYAIQAIENEQWILERVVLRLAAHEDTLVKSVRPYLRNVMPWQMGNLARIVGPGIFKAAVAEARSIETEQFRTQTDAYYDAFEGEAAYWRGEYGEAIELAEKALAHLPSEPVLLRRRVQAWLADALRRTDHDAAAIAHLHEVMQHFPTALRHLQITLPAAIEREDNALTQLVAKRLERSIRLDLTVDPSTAPFIVSVERSKRVDGVEVLGTCIRNASGRQYGCGWAPSDESKTDEAWVEAALEEFHHTVFSPKVELTSSDINSLDGSPVRVDADTMLEGLLEK